MRRWVAMSFRLRNLQPPSETRTATAFCVIVASTARHVLPLTAHERRIIVAATHHTQGTYRGLIHINIYSAQVFQTDLIKNNKANP